MKKIIAISLLLIPVILSAQSNKLKVYAYQQQVLPGVKANTIDESGATKEIQNKIPPRSFIYIEVPKANKKTIEPRHLWINGKLYGVKSSVPQLPVLMHSTTIPSNTPDTLVRATENRVLQLEPVPGDVQFNPSATAKKKIKTHQVVIHTLENGKNCYYYVEHMNVLDPVALQ